MDSTAEEFYETEDGCYFCELALKNKPVGSISDFTELIPEPSAQYDVLLGLSGGVDSSYCLHILKEMGYRVLTFSVDNGWNDPVADENIMRLVEGTKTPFIRYTIDIEKFRELQSAFIQAGVKNIEIPTDHILMASSLEIANMYGIKTIISGGNWATESIMPRSWGYQPRDLRHIRGVYRRYTGKRLSGLPTCGLLRWNWYKWVTGIRTVNMLDYFNYRRADAIAVLSENYGYKSYGEKHGESVFTKWFQNFYLYEKFGIDKRKAHLSSLILSGQITRAEAIEELTKNPVYPRLGIEDRILRIPKHEYTDFPNDEKVYEFISKVIRTVRDSVKRLRYVRPSGSH